MAYLADDIVTAVKRLTFLPDASDLHDRHPRDGGRGGALHHLRLGEVCTHGDVDDAPGLHALGLHAAVSPANRALGRIVRGVQIVNTTSNISFVIAQRDLIQGWDALPTAGVTSATYYFDDDYICFPAALPPGT